MVSYQLKESQFHGLPLYEVQYDYDLPKLELHSQPYHKIVIHHSGSKRYTLQQLIDRHMGVNGMGAIGYHFVINDEGNIYSVRDLRFKGAHAFPNEGKIGIGFLRSFDFEEPNLYEKESLKLLVTALRKVFSITEIIGHRHDQIVELKRKYSFLEHHSDLFEPLSKPFSDTPFQEAKIFLRKCSQNPRFHEAVSSLKTCPGIMAYQSGLLSCLEE